MELKYKSWGTLPVGKYERIKEIIRAGMDNSDVEVLAVLCDCSVDDVLNAPVGKVVGLKRESMFLNEPINVKDRLRFKSIKLDGVEYEIHTDVKDITTAQYLDFQTFYKEFEKNYCNVLACFIIPKGHKYNDGYDALETAEIFKEKLPVEVAENACFFFARQSSRLLRKGMLKLVWKTAVMMTRIKTPEIREQMENLRKELLKQSDAIDGLDRLMRSLILRG